VLVGGLPVWGAICGGLEAVTLERDSDVCDGRGCRWRGDDELCDVCAGEKCLHGVCQECEEPKPYASGRYEVPYDGT
jgi:hypothetical protein